MANVNGQLKLERGGKRSGSGFVLLGNGQEKYWGVYR